MVSKCANQACHVPFLYLGNGRLLAVESFSAPARVEFFWLCGECATRFKLEATSSGVEIVPSVQTVNDPKTQFLRLSRTWRSTARPSSDIASEARG